MIDPLEGFETLATRLSKGALQLDPDRWCKQMAIEIQGIIASARASMTQALRDEFVAGWQYNPTQCDCLWAETEARRRNP